MRKVQASNPAQPGRGRRATIPRMSDPTTRKAWFKPWGLGYLPTSWQGFVATLLVVLICVVVFLVIDADSHSASDTMVGTGFIIVPIIGALYWFARARSRDR